MVATSFSFPPSTANACASQTLMVRPGFRTRPKQKMIAPRRSDEIGLELDGQDRCIFWHQRESGISAGCIERGRDDARVNKTMLLRISGGVRHPQLNLAGLSAISIPSVAIAVWRAKLVRTRASKLSF